MALQYKLTGVEGVKIIEGVPGTIYERLLTEGFFLTLRALERATRDDRAKALQVRAAAQEAYNKGGIPRYKTETREIRQSDWNVKAKRPKNLTYQYAELVSPVSKASRIKRGFEAITRHGPHINGHYAAVFFADGEDAESPFFIPNVLGGQLNLYLALRNELEIEGYPTKQAIPAVKYRPRGIHLEEINILVDGKPASAMAFDTTLFYHPNVRLLKKIAESVNIYTPKLETIEDAAYVKKLQNNLEDLTNQERGTIHNSLIIETAPALVHMDEFAWELKDYVGEYSFGRYDMLFHMLMTFAKHPDKILPDEKFVSMDSPFLALAQASMVDVCYRRGIYPQGGMEAWVPQKDRKKNADISEMIRAGALGELKRHMTGKWILHPDSVDDIVIMFMAGMNGKPTHNYIPSGMHPNEELLFQYPTGIVTAEDTKLAVYFALGYLADFFGGNGASQMKMKMFDAAVVEIQTFKLLERKNKGVISDDTGIPITLDLMVKMLNDQKVELIKDGKNPEHIEMAKRLLEERLMSNDPGKHIIADAYQIISGQRII